MNCPTCRRPEQDRTMESLQREIVRLNRLFTTNTTSAEISATDEAFLEGLFDGFDFNDFNDFSFTLPSDFSFTLPSSVTVRPRRTRTACGSGRDCRSRSQRRSRTVTHLKCNLCNVVFCCRNCGTCVGCAPI